MVSREHAPRKSPATADTLGRVRPTLHALPDRARKICQAGQAAMRVTEDGSGARAHRPAPAFCPRGDRRRWARSASSSCSPAPTGRAGPTNCSASAAALTSRQELESFLNGEAAAAVEEMVRPKLAGFHVTSDEMLGQAAAWLRGVAEQAAPQFSFHEVKCGEHGQTYFAQLLAVGSRSAAERLLKEFPTLPVEVVETGDPHQIVYTAQRKLVPLHAAISNLPSLERAYRYWWHGPSIRPRQKSIPTAPTPRWSASR
jgi:hypothetical protein